MVSSAGETVLVYPPLEGTPHELEADAVPDLPGTGAGQLELIAEKGPLARELILDFLCVDGHMQPFPVGQELFPSPTGGVGLDVGESGFLALDPDVGHRLGRRKPGGSRHERESRADRQKMRTHLGTPPRLMVA